MREPLAGRATIPDKETARYPVEEPRRVESNETTFGKLIPTEGPTFPGWPGSSNGTCSSTPDPAILPATPSVAIRRRSFKDARAADLKSRGPGSFLAMRHALA